MKENYLKGLGLHGYEGNAEFNPAEFNMERIDAIREIIRPRLRKIKNINRNHTSYGIKHRVEEQIEASVKPLQRYVANGELIYAMILEGFDVLRFGINASFNVSEGSLNIMPREPRYDRNGNVYNMYDWRYNKKPCFKVDMERFGDLVREKFNKKWRNF